MLQARRLQVQYPMVSLEFFIDRILSVLMALRSTQLLTEMSSRNISWRVKAAIADNLTTFMC